MRHPGFGNKNAFLIVIRLYFSSLFLGALKICCNRTLVTFNKCHVDWRPLSRLFTLPVGKFNIKNIQHSFISRFFFLLFPVPSDLWCKQCIIEKLICKK